MPWTTPTLLQVRQNARAYLMAALPGADALIANSNLRVMTDGNAGLAHLNLQYIDWLANQFLPDTAETEFLDRWANLFLINSDSSRGRKQATLASGSVTATGAVGTVVPAGATLRAGNAINYQVTAQTTLGAVATTVPIVALTAGAVGNLDPGTTISFQTSIVGLSGNATVVTLEGGADTETDDELRIRVLERLAEPPMGGDAEDYVAWALAVPGVTRAWSAPNEMGIGTVTVRFMMDDLRASSGGFPTQDDVNAVTTYIDSVRPVTLKDRFIEAPIPWPINFTIRNLDSDAASTWANIATSVAGMLFVKARPSIAINGVLQPATTIYSAWVSQAIMEADGVNFFDLVMADAVPPANGYLAILGSIIHG